jgi:hypothetical protein
MECVLKKLRFAFVAFSKNKDKFLADPSYIYRCENLALALRAAGHDADLVHYNDFSAGGDYDLVMFHRPKRRIGLSFLLRRLHKQGVITIADFDDLVFDPTAAHLSPAVLNGLSTQRKIEQQYRSHATALKKFQRVSVSTEPLRQSAQQLYSHSQVLVIPNTVHYSWYQATPKRQHPAHWNLTYFPGTRSHDRDFAMIRAPLEQFLDEHPGIQLHITGVLDYELRCRPAQLVQHDKQKFSKYHRFVAQSWVNLAPLENTLFNQHKSAIKAIEAAYWHAPTLASPIPDMQRMQHCGAVLATDLDQWYQQLTALADPEYYCEQTQGLRERLLRQSSVEQFAAQLIEIAQQR